MRKTASIIPITRSAALAEVLLDALSQVTHDPEKFSGFSAGTRALQLPDVRMDSYFLSIFGRPQRLQTSESERQTDPSVIQALDLINGETLNKEPAPREARWTCW